MIQAILVELLYGVPYFIVWLAGIIIAIVRWQRHPRLSMLVLIVFVLYIIAQVINAVFSIMLPQIVFDRHLNFGIITIIQETLDIVLFIPLWGLLLWAIFGWRKPGTTAGAVPLAQPQWMQVQPQPPFQSWQPQPPQWPQAQFQPPQPQPPQPGQPQFQAQPPQPPQPPQSPPASSPPPNQAQQ